MNQETQGHSLTKKQRSKISRDCPFKSTKNIFLKTKKLKIYCTVLIHEVNELGIHFLIVELHFNYKAKHPSNQNSRWQYSFNPFFYSKVQFC
jgi:hypothetical protein